jgi:hypothetical protein
MKRIVAVLLCFFLLVAGVPFAAVAAAPFPSSTHIRINADQFGGGEMQPPEQAYMTQEVTGQVGIGGMMLYWFSKQASQLVTPPTYNITQMDFFEIQVYFSDISYLEGIPFCFELTSSGTCDYEEDCIVATWKELAGICGTTLKNGWNDLRIPLSAFPKTGADRTRINCFRWFCNSNFTIPADKPLVYEVRQVSFGTNDQGTVHVIPFDKEIGVGGSLTIVGALAAKTWTFPAGKDLRGGAGMISSWKGAPMNLTRHKYVDLQMYVENVEAIKGVQFEIELTSSGTCDQQENNYTGFFKDIVEGWNTIRIPIAAFSRRTGGEANLAAINFIRMYTVSGTPAKDAVFGFGYFEFVREPDTTLVEYSIPVGGDAALPENVKLISKAQENSTVMFADGKSEIVYEVKLDDAKIEGIYFKGSFAGAQALIQIAPTSSGTYKDIWNADSQIRQLGEYLIDVSAYCDIAPFNQDHTLYFRVADYDTSNGNGGAIAKGTSLSFYVVYEGSDGVDYGIPEDPALYEADIKELTPDEHTIPLFGCNMEVAGFSVDYQDFKVGSSSLSYTLGTFTNAAGEQVTQNGQSGFAFNTSDFPGKEFVDATKMDTLEFWFYVSDKDALSAVSFVDNAMELTSSGSYDREEVCWRMSDILDQCTQNGWNAIKLNFEQGSGAQNVNWGHLNYMRWYFIQASNLPANPITIKIDNIRLTDYRAQQMVVLRPVGEKLANKITQALEGIPD